MNKRRTILLLGGARSGKSRFGQQLALRLTPRPVYVATSRTWDEEHAARIERHRADRGPEWITIEEPLEISGAALGYPVVLVDCVTLWLTNIFAQQNSDLDPSLDRAKAEIDRCLQRANTWIWISNELGQGVHASTMTARRFVDLQGFVNQYLAAQVEAVALMVAGLPHVVKGTLP
jgi:adenosylcobinamide kinase/adenosylcobinamide-phosphate guanylyltransferase